MSQPRCDACTDLREYAPEFVVNGVTEAVETSLLNGTGLNPALTVTHENCEDMKDLVDCLIGRKIQELEKLGVCDWKEFMSGFGPNLYETMKAMVINACRIDQLCKSVDNILELFSGSAGPYHYFTPTATWQSKARNFDTSRPHDVYPIIRAQIKSGAGCTDSKSLGTFQFTMGAKTPMGWVGNGYGATDLAAGDDIGYIHKSVLVPEFMTENAWESLMRGARIFNWMSLNGNTIITINPHGNIVLDGVEYNVADRSYGRDVLVLSILGFVGDDRSGGIWGTSDRVHTYIVSEEERES